MNDKESCKLICDYVLVENDNTKRGKKNLYRVVPIFVNNLIRCGKHPTMSIGKIVHAECNYGMFSHDGANQIYNGPWEITFTVNKNDWATLVSIKEVSDESAGR